MTFTESDINLIYRLLMAHMISDYFLQSGAWSYDKESNRIKSSRLYWHLGITFLSAWLFSLDYSVALFIGISHGLIDAGKMYLKGNRFLLFAADQTCHFCMILLAAYLFPQQLSEIAIPWFSHTRLWVQLFVLVVISLPYGIVSKIFLYPARSGFSPENHETWAKWEMTVGIAERVSLAASIFFFNYWWITLYLPVKLLLAFVSLSPKGTRYVFFQTIFSLLPTFLLTAASDYLLHKFL